MGDYKACKIVGKGKVLIKLHNENQWMLNRVRHILGLRRNIISSGQLDDEGSTTTHKKIVKGHQVIFGISKVKQIWYVVSMYR